MLFICHLMGCVAYWTATGTQQDYVYGILAKSGVGDRAHNLAHMMASGLCDKADVNLDLGFGVDGGGIGA